MTDNIKMNKTNKLVKKKSLLSVNVMPFDMPFFILTIVLLTIGVSMMFSASYAFAKYDPRYMDSFYFIKKQLPFAAVGVVLMLIVSRIDYHFYHKFALPILGVTYVLLGVVLLLPPINNVHRWISLPGLSIQPSEIAKFAIVLFFAHYISHYADKMNKFRHGVLPFALVLGSIAALLLMEPHLSGTVLILLIGAVMMLVGGTKLRWFGLVGLLAVGVLVYLVFFTKKIEYATERIEMWLDPFKDLKGDGWQTVQSLYAISSGGFLGVGFGQSKQKFMYISEPQNDFVFAVVCEELGFVGATIIIILFALLIWRGFVIAIKSPDKFGSFLAMGLIVQVGIQAILNIAVVTNSIPNTGIGLPFFSYGGSSLLMLLVQMGVILNISRSTVIEKT